MNIFATARETFFGLLIYIVYLKNEIYTHNKSIDTSIFIELYIQNILHIDKHYHKKFIKIIENIQADFNEIIRHWIQIDDNKEYLKIWHTNRIHFSKEKTLEETKKSIISEDIIWFKWFLKNISYYNKRFLMPQ